MNPCLHTDWFGLVNHDGDLSAYTTDRAKRLLPYQGRSCDGEEPAMIALIGKGGMMEQRALESFDIRHNHVGRRPRGAECNLHVLHKCPKRRWPLLVAESRVPTPVPRTNQRHTAKRPRCHELSIFPIVRHTATQDKKEKNNLALRFWNYTLRPFADVICFFATDKNDALAILTCLREWRTLGPPCNPHIKTSILVVYEIGDASSSVRLRDALEEIRSEITAQDVHTTVELFPITSTATRIRRSEYRRLRTRIEYLSKAAREKRQEMGILFSAHHICHYLQHIPAYFAQRLADVGDGEPFDLIKAARSGNPFPVNQGVHIREFLSYFQTSQGTKQMAIPVIASSLLFDHQTAAMHRFPPNLFLKYYEEALRLGFEEACASTEGVLDFRVEGGSVETFLALVESHVTAAFNSHSSSIEQDHMNLLSTYKHSWAKIKSSSTCLTCIRRPPTITLPCGHCICEQCIRRLCSSSSSNFNFTIPSCLLCQEPCDLEIRLKPDTARPRILSIDGGGVRGLIPLEFLKELESRIALPGIPLRDHFDGAFGTSAGGLVVLAMFLRRLNIRECIHQFEELSRLAFRPRALAGFVSKFCHPIFGSLLGFCVAMLATDSLYPSRGIEKALRDTFGSTMGMRTCSKKGVVGAKVGMTATSLVGERVWLFTNYIRDNKNDGRDGDDGEPEEEEYHVAPGMNTSSGISGKTEDIPVWKIARCGTAAPYYFTPMQLRGLGVFQDGGLWVNNPIELALQESRVLFPHNSEPGLVISLGTGSFKTTSSSSSSSSSLSSEEQPRNPIFPSLKNRFIPRLLRTLMTSMDGSRTWKRFSARQHRHLMTSHSHSHTQNQQKKKQKQIFRFDVQFPSGTPELRLDEASQIPLIRDFAVVTNIEKEEEMDELANRMIAELFYVELDSAPVFRRPGEYAFEGNILCRLPQGSDGLASLLRRLEDEGAYFAIAGKSLLRGLSDDDDDGKGCSFRKTLSGAAFSRRSSEIGVMLIRGGKKGEEREREYHVSGSPFTLDELVRVQGLDDAFGTSFGGHNNKKRRGGVEVEGQRSGVKRRRLL